MADKNEEIKQEFQAEEIVTPAQDVVEEPQVEEQPKVEDVAPVEDAPTEDKVETETDVEEKPEATEPEKVEKEPEQVEEPSEEVVEPEKEEEKPTEEEEEKPEVVEEQVDVEAIKRELEELRAEKEERAELEALNKENAKVAREFDELCGKLGEALEGELKKFGIPLDKSIEELEAEDKAKADIARRLTQEANDLIERAKQDANKFIADKARDLVFKKADRMLKGYEVSEEDRIVQEFGPVRHIKEDFDVSDDYQHKPSEGNAGVHISQKFVPLPYFQVQKAVAEYVPDVFEQNLGIDQREKESFSVLVW